MQNLHKKTLEANMKYFVRAISKDDGGNQYAWVCPVSQTNAEGTIITLTRNGVYGQLDIGNIIEIQFTKLDKIGESPY